MINEKNNFLTVSWLSGLLSAEIFISTGEWGVQMPSLTSENSYFLRSGPQGATLVMWPTCLQLTSWCAPHPNKINDKNENKNLHNTKSLQIYLMKLHLFLCLSIIHWSTLTRMLALIWLIILSPLVLIMAPCYSWIFRKLESQIATVRNVQRLYESKLGKGLKLIRYGTYIFHFHTCHLQVMKQEWNMEVEMKLNGSYGWVPNYRPVVCVPS